jgi:hypothetical protein
MASTIASGTQSATAAHALDSAATTTAGVYVAMWNLTNMVATAVIKCYVETKVLTGDTAIRIYEATYQHAQGNVAIVASPPIVSMFSIRMYVEEVGANTISVPWALLRIDA